MSKFLFWVSIIISFLVISVGVVLIFWYLFKNKSKSSDTNLYRLVDNLSGDTLIPDSDPRSSKVMKYFTGTPKDSGQDPTHGSVNYGIHTELISKTVQTDGKTRIQISAGPKPESGNRKMIRMVSNKMYDNGLFVISANHIPEGNGVWPSFWLDSSGGGKKWACDGEIDIIEGVNSIDDNSSRNVSTLHTNDKDGFPGCRQDGVDGISETDCSKNDKPTLNGCGCTPTVTDKNLCPNIGCGVYLKSTNSFGFGFNKAGGGTYACELTPEGAITIWFFPVGTEPKDLLEDNPNPDTWPSTNRTKFKPCPGQFANLAMTLNTTLCGDWAGADTVFKNPTQPQQKCDDYIKTADLTNAYWSIEYIKVFIKN